MDGFLLIDKPQGPSSFTAVAHVRRLYKIRKAGHTGTLDPLASGLLIVALGQSTRLIPYLSLEPKRYIFRVRFGTQTDTLDSEGKIVYSGGHLPGYTSVMQVCAVFGDGYEQYPPEYSAVRIDGVRAYELARSGKQVRIAPRRIHLHEFRCVNYDVCSGSAEFTVTCSGGTYVRSLARDIARELGTFGFASMIRRTGAGAFSVEQAKNLDDLDGTDASILKASDILQHYQSVVLGKNQMELVSRGRAVVLDTNLKTYETVIAYKENGVLAAVLVRKCPGPDDEHSSVVSEKMNSGPVFHPVRVFHDETGN